MSTHALPHVTRPGIGRLTAVPAVTHWLWLAGGLVLGFAIPFVLADSLELNRDLYYGLYGAAVIGYVGAWARTTRQPVRRLTTARVSLTLGITLVASALLVLAVYKREDATPRPDGLELVAAVAWRGVFYGLVDGLLLSVFPILVVFAAFAGSKLRQERRGTALVALVALVASLGMTAVYHAGYSDFRGEKMRQPLTGAVGWSAPTLLTLNPVASPIAHAATHTAAVLHSYETDTFLPPHPSDESLALDLDALEPDARRCRGR